MGKITYVMDSGRFSRLVKDGKLVCRVCGEPINVGDVVLSSYANNKTKVYHKVCFESLYQCL